jgi:endo-1,4-beta-xylanase
MRTLAAANARRPNPSGVFIALLLGVASCSQILGIHDLPPANDAGAGGDAGVDGGHGAGGSTGLGGNTGADGGAGSGGRTGVGGNSGAGGGGVLGTGGVTGAGGMTGTTGTGGAGTGGVLGTGGATGSGGAGTGGGLGTGGAVTAGTGGAPGSGGASGIGGAGGASSACMAGTTLTGGQQFCSNTSGNVGNGYSYQLYSNTTGSGCMTVYDVDAAFSATWSNPGDFLARVGLVWNSTETFDQLGTISADYAYTKTGTGGGFSYIGIYGWSENPLHEYYIVDDWFGSPSPPTGGGTKVGTFTVDGGTYNVYQHTQTNQPAITGGNATFMQYFSVRQTARQCGHISISEHFKAWASLGLTLGDMAEARILVEVGGGSGSINFTTATVTAE